MKANKRKSGANRNKVMWGVVICIIVCSMSFVISFAHEYADLATLRKTEGRLLYDVDQAIQQEGPYDRCLEMLYTLHEQIDEQVSKIESLVCIFAGGIFCITVFWGSYELITQSLNEEKPEEQKRIARSEQIAKTRRRRDS